MVPLGVCFLMMHVQVASAAAADDNAQCACGEEEKAVLPMMLALPISIVLVMLSGLFSGLTLGLMGLDLNGLQIVERGDNTDMARCAKRIMPLREKGNQLLCTLLLGNVAVNSALSILTADMFNGVIGFLVSTALIVIFGEIIPQAACSRYALQVGARTVPIVKFLMVVMWLFTKPLSLMLDCVLGREMGTVLSRAELMEMLKLQIRLGAADEETGNIAKQVAEGAMSFRDKHVSQVMTPLEDAYMLPFETRLGYKTIREIFETGFSRVPVYGKDKNDFKGLLCTKDLMLADPEDEMRLGDFIAIFNRKVESFFADTKLVDTLNRFKKGGTHMALVRQTNMVEATDPKIEIIGVVTLEDVMEEILQEEIVDETDVYVDVDNHVQVQDGREKRLFNLAVFSPVWGLRTEGRLSHEEANAVAAHLSRSVFTHESGMFLGPLAVKWLVVTAEVTNRERSSAIAEDSERHADCLYMSGKETDRCTLVLQGRVALRVGVEAFRCEAGAFSVLAKDALRPGRAMVSDFSAYIGTVKVRLLTITRAKYMEAVVLDRQPEVLQSSLNAIAAEAAGEASRQEARALGRVQFCQ